MMTTRFCIGRRCGRPLDWQRDRVTDADTASYFAFLASYCRTCRDRRIAERAAADMIGTVTECR